MEHKHLVSFFFNNNEMDSFFFKINAPDNMKKQGTAKVVKQLTRRLGNHEAKFPL